MSKYNYTRTTTLENHTYRVIFKNGHYRVYYSPPGGGETEIAKYGKTAEDKRLAEGKVDNLTGVKNKELQGKQLEKAQAEKPAEEPTPFENAADITKEHRSNKEAEYALTEHLKAQSRKTGIPISELLNDMVAKGVPEHLKEKYPELADGIPDPIYNDISYLITQKDDTETLGDIFDESKNKRSEIVSDLKENTVGKREGQEGAELSLMLDPSVNGEKYSGLYDRLSEDQKASATPELLRRLAQEQEGQKLKDLGNRQSEETGEVKNQINMDPTSLWNTVEGIYQSPTKYDSDSLYNRRGHQLANSGHGFGSTTLNDNEANKNRARRDSDHQGKLALYDRFLNYMNISRGDLIKMNQEERNSMADPFKTSSDAMNQSLNRDNENQYRQDVFQKDLATGEINNEQQSLNESLNNYNNQSSVNQQQNQQAVNTLNSIYQLGLEEQNFNQLNDQQKNALEVQKENLWAQRQQVLTQMGQLNLNREAQQDLQRARQAKDKTEFIGLIVKIAAAAAITIGTGGSGAPAALALFAPSAGQALSNTPGYFGNSATAQSKQDPLMG